jgi:hypothetical protein
MVTRSRIWLAVLVGCLALFLPWACVSVITSADEVPAGPVGDDCDSNGFLGSPGATPSTSSIRSIRLPDDAVLVLATRCLFQIRPVPGDGEWMFRIEQRADSGLDALATALRLPSQWFHLGVCNAVGHSPDVITVTDATGRTLHPVLPKGPCDGPLPKAVDAVNAVPWQTTATVKVRQLRSEPEVASGCPGASKPVVAMRAAQGDPAGEPFTINTSPATLNVCVYVPDPTDTGADTIGSLTLHTGKLAKVSTVDGSAAVALLSAIAAAPTATGTCTGEAPFATIAQPADLAFELGGCYRALDGNSLRQLDPATVQGWHLG